MPYVFHLFKLLLIVLMMSYIYRVCKTMLKRYLNKHVNFSITLLKLSVKSLLNNKKKIEEHCKVLLHPNVAAVLQFVLRNYNIYDNIPYLIICTTYEHMHLNMPIYLFDTCIN